MTALYAGLCVLFALVYLSKSNPVNPDKQSPLCGPGDDSSCSAHPPLTREIKGHQYTFLGWSGYGAEFRASRLLLMSKRKSIGVQGRAVYIYEKLGTARELMKKEYKSPRICATYTPTESFKSAAKIFYPRRYQLHYERDDVTHTYVIQDALDLGQYKRLLVQTSLATRPRSPYDADISITAVDDDQSDDEGIDSGKRLQMVVPPWDSLKYECVSIEDSYQWRDPATWKERSEDTSANDWKIYNKNPQKIFYYPLNMIPQLQPVD
ncbi:hypothetical protein BKA69DRAFT_1126909 [Paraphysoderma sedebokerense]|nr:hypothetical protein BKA69DRAFT_1126909 [Paraphysoderma sedebokerense]